MDDFDILLMALVNVGALLVRRRRERMRNERRQQRRVWVREINMRRRQQGAFYNIFQEPKRDDTMFYKYARMTLPSFQHLMDIVNPSLIKRSARAIAPEQRVALMLRFLIGGKVPAISFAYRVGQSTAHKIIKETCDVFGSLLGPISLQIPSKKEFLEISEGFWKVWNFSHCLGAIDGKHSDSQCPPNFGSLYFNYHKRYCIVLMVVCDHNYKFTVVDIGSIEKNSDRGIYCNSDLNPDNGLLDIPEGVRRLSNSDMKVPYFFVGDEAFPIGKHLMRRYPGRFVGERKKILFEF